MYCSECGNAIRPELNFCNRCGAVVQGSSSGNNEVASNLANVVGAIGVIGMLGFLAVLYLLLSNGVNWAGVTWISLFYLTALCIICSRILKLIGAQTGKSTTYRQHARTPGELNSSPAAHIIEDRGTPASVVENTTRSLDDATLSRK